MAGRVSDRGRQQRIDQDDAGLAAKGAHLAARGAVGGLETIGIAGDQHPGRSGQPRRVQRLHGNNHLDLAGPEGHRPLAQNEVHLPIGGREGAQLRALGGQLEQEPAPGRWLVPSGQLRRRMHPAVGGRWGQPVQQRPAS